MSVTVEGEVIRLSGRCGAEDAEALLAALHDGRNRAVDLSGLQRLHLAVLQILLAARPSIRGTPDSTFLAAHLNRLLSEKSDT
ncbi:STAS domain-containing protein [Altericroceibacterium xinjiangense]|uniref:STAS domain-containing protein n=1 Tax=Altericroceibacterium xinjiangense TaxID=762261 RepID=UPI000F7F2E8A|nr:STAS domain-containing protein [Altericroceibacterium xinjiangense]